MRQRAENSGVLLTTPCAMCTSRNPYGYGCPRLPACSTYLTGPTGATGPTGETGIPVGTILPYGGPVTAPPAGYLACNGAAKSTAMYAALYAVIGDTFDTGAASGTFNVPDMRGRVPVGAGPGPGPGPLAIPLVLGEFGGDETVTLTLPQIPAHDHATATVAIPGFEAVEVQAGVGGFAITTAGSTEATVVNVSNGAGEAHPNMQPYLALNYIIKY